MTYEEAVELCQQYDLTFNDSIIKVESTTSFSDDLDTAKCVHGNTNYYSEQHDVPFMFGEGKKSAEIMKRYANKNK